MCWSFSPNLIHPCCYWSIVVDDIGAFWQIKKIHLRFALIFKQNAWDESEMLQNEGILWLQVRSTENKDMFGEWRNSGCNASGSPFTRHRGWTLDRKWWALFVNRHERARRVFCHTQQTSDVMTCSLDHNRNKNTTDRHCDSPFPQREAATSKGGNTSFTLFSLNNNKNQWRKWF